MKQNLMRMHASNVELFTGDASAPPLVPLDAVLLDVPCTGTGAFRRHPDARWRLKISDIAVMSATQRTLLASAAKLVKPGGLLIYSTCSLEPEENDAPVAAFLAANPGWSLEPPPAGAVPDIVLDRGLLRVLPQLHGVDGAFAARLRKSA
jgi:16S rRNA (cytosine967-C5)-methyltransferase